MSSQRLQIVVVVTLGLFLPCPVLAGHGSLEPIPLSDVKWTTGFWADRFQTCRSDMVPAMSEIMHGTKHSHFLENFRIAAGLSKGWHRGPPWNDGDLYKWLEALTDVYAVTRDEKLDRQMDEVIEIIAKAQRDDGYLHTPVLIKNKRGEDVLPFQDRLNFEMYNFGHLFSTACAHHRATGKKSLLVVAMKVAEFLGKAFAKPSAQLAKNNVCPSHYMGTVELYRLTRDKKLLALAETFLALRDVAEDGTDDNQDRLPFRKQTEAVGHAVRANYLCAGVADIYLETGDKTLLDPLEKLWANVTRRKLYVTGACGALYDGASPAGSKNQKTISRTHQAYGHDYQLPNSMAHNETCAAVGNVLWNERMLRIRGEAKYADVLELSLINAVLAGVSLDGKRYFYTNTLRQLDTMPVALRWSRSREPFISCYCCPPNVVRTIAGVGGLVYGRSERGLWVHLYGGNVVDTQLPGKGRVKLTQKTDYPWDGKVTLTVNGAPVEEMSLYLRIPGWAKNATIRVNGDGIGGEQKPGSYAEVRRKWKEGDVVELNLPMNAVLLEAHPLVEEVRNQIAVKRGPVVYCLESRDLVGAKVLSVSLPPTAAFTARYDARLLGGVTVLEGKGQQRDEPAWGDELFRELKPMAAKSIEVKLIPYFAWGNRGASEMTVWLLLGR